MWLSVRSKESRKKPCLACWANTTKWWMPHPLHLLNNKRKELVSLFFSNDTVDTRYVPAHKQCSRSIKGWYETFKWYKFIDVKNSKRRWRSTGHELEENMKINCKKKTIENVWKIREKQRQPWKVVGQLSRASMTTVVHLYSLVDL